MDFKEMMIQYLFYYNHTVCSVIDIEEDILNLYEYMAEFENLDFNSWLKDNDLEEEYNTYRSRI